VRFAHCALPAHLFQRSFWPPNFFRAAAFTRIDGDGVGVAVISGVGVWVGAVVVVGGGAGGAAVEPREHAPNVNAPTSTRLISAG
jgi:hypothetical protein